MYKLKEVEESFNKLKIGKIENIKTQLPEMKTIMFENKNMLDEINSKLDTVEEKMSALEYTATETVLNESQRNERTGGGGRRTEYQWALEQIQIAWYIHVLGVLKEEVGKQNIWNTGWICSKWEENCHVTNSRSLMNPKHKKREEHYAKFYHKQIV